MRNDMWHHIRQEAEQYRISPNASAWQRLRRRLDKVPTRHVRLLPLPTWAMAAAIAGLIAIAAWQLYHTNRQDNRTLHYAHQPMKMEMLNRQDADTVARMAIDFTHYLEEHYPEMLR